MAWAALAAAAVPLIMDAMKGKPDMPQMAAISRPDRSNYINQLLASGFDPQSEIYSLAAKEMSNQVNRQLALLGLTNSSYGMGMMNDAQSDLARKFAADAFQKQLQAMTMVSNYDNAIVNQQMDQNQALYNAAMGNYNAQMGDRNSQIQGWANLAGTAAGAYTSHQEQKRIDAQRAEDRAFFERIYGSTKPQMGVPYQGSQPGTVMMRYNPQTGRYEY